MNVQILISRRQPRDEREGVRVSREKKKRNEKEGSVR